MSESPAARPALSRRPVPGEAWVLAWVFLAGQVAYAVDRGVKEPDDPMLVSVVLGVVVVRWFSSGVVTARPVRSVLVWVFVGLSLPVAAYAVLRHPGSLVGAPGAELLLEVAAAAALFRFTRTDFHRSLWGQPVPRDVRRALSGVLWIAVLVGVLAGMVVPTGTVHVGIHV